VNSEIGAEGKVLEAVKQIFAVQEAHVVHGVYNIILRVVAPSMDELKEIITTNIRTLENVRSTMTMIVVEAD
ncbi:MAG: Lrp/AsnC ligand binding domain-containing protein, partial [Candidatus Hodarchaeales archaeon]